MATSLLEVLSVEARFTWILCFNESSAMLKNRYVQAYMFYEMGSILVKAQVCYLFNWLEIFYEAGIRFEKGDFDGFEKVSVGHKGRWICCRDWFTDETNYGQQKSNGQCALLTKSL
jgi:hypothetical protein